MLDKEHANTELEKIEKLAGIVNPRDFRHEIVNFCLRYRATNKGENPNWTTYEKMKEVIEKKMFSAIDEILPVISFSTKKDKKTEKDHAGFVKRMTDMGYTEKQIRRLVEYYVRAKNSR
jgi:serine protein kinase